jgi:hypothetical protein
MTASIEFVCRAHVYSEDPGPLITLVDGRWAYCAGRADGGHDWIRIPPTRREHIGDQSQMEEREAS